MKIDEGWNLVIGSNQTVYGNYGDEMQVRLDLRQAYLFTSYNQTAKELTIEKGSLTENEVGSYLIDAYAHFSNLTYTEHYKTSFTLTILNVPNQYNQEDGDIKIESGKEWNELTNLTFSESLELGEYEDGQPLPYIRDFTNSGMLVI